MWLTCNMFIHYVQTGSKNTQTCQVEVVILIQHQILITNYCDSAGFSKFEVIWSIKLAIMHQMGAKYCAYYKHNYYFQDVLFLNKGFQNIIVN